MSIFPPTGLGEAIVLELVRGPLETGVLLERLKRRGLSVTKQGVYKALRLMRQQNMVFLVRGEALLNIHWLQRLGSFASLAGHAHASADPSVQEGHVLQMHDGDRVIYSFKNPVQTDEFWNHILYVLFEALPKLDRWFAYSSHCWFLLGRRKEELALKSFMAKRKIRYLFTVGHHLSLDRVVAHEFDGTWSQYHMLDEPLFPKRANRLGIVLNILGDYVIEAQYDRGIVERIEKFYKTNERVGSEMLKELEKIVAQPARIKFTIEKNSIKAARLSKMFERNFYFGEK